MEKKFFIVASFVASGSSVVCDLLQEVKGMGALMDGKELKLIKEPYGLIELQKCLTGDGWSWWKCNEAIRQFVRFYQMVGDPYFNVYDYGKVINKDFIQYSDEFVRSLVNFEFEPGSSMSGLLEKFWNPQKEHRYIRKIKKSFRIRKDKSLRSFFSDISASEYVDVARKYINNLFSGDRWDQYDGICLDQALHPLDGNYLHDYFPKGKMIVVSRNPMDQCASMIERKKGIGVEMSKRPNHEVYISWLMRQKRNLPKGDDIFYCNYEDMILDYDNKVKELLEFCHIDPALHIRPKKYFDPDVSKTRIGKWKKYLEDPKYAELFKGLKKACDEGRLY